MLAIEPVGLALGARIRGVDLAQDLHDESWRAVLGAFEQHSVLVFPDQDLTIDQQKAFAGRFGDVEVHAHLLPMTVEGHPECMRLHNNEEKPPGLNAWHTDNSGWARPPLGTMLYAKITPEVGGDTLFSSMYSAYEQLSPPLQEFLLDLHAVHDVRKAFGPAYADVQRTLRRGKIDPNDHFADYEPVEHPLVRTHPGTGRKALYLSSPYVTGIRGLSAAESGALLDFLYRHIETNEFIYRHQWTVGDLVVWDNRCTQHFAVADYYPRERLMHRMNIAGERPFLVR